MSSKISHFAGLFLIQVSAFLLAVISVVVVLVPATSSAEGAGFTVGNGAPVAPHQYVVDGSTVLFPLSAVMAILSVLFGFLVIGTWKVSNTLRDLEQKDKDNEMDLARHREAAREFWNVTNKRLEQLEGRA